MLKTRRVPYNYRSMRRRRGHFPLVARIAVLVAVVAALESKRCQDLKRYLVRDARRGNLLKEPPKVCRVGRVRKIWHVHSPKLQD